MGRLAFLIPISLCLIIFYSCSVSSKVDDVNKTATGKKGKMNTNQGNSINLEDQEEHNSIRSNMESDKKLNENDNKEDDKKL